MSIQGLAFIIFIFFTAKQKYYKKQNI